MSLSIVYICLRRAHNAAPKMFASRRRVPWCSSKAMQPKV